MSDGSRGLRRQKNASSAAGFITTVARILISFSFVRHFGDCMTVSWSGATAGEQDAGAAAAAAAAAEATTTLTTSPCSRERLELCSAPLNNEFRYVSDALMPFYNDSALDQLCRQIQTARSCLSAGSQLPHGKCLPLDSVIHGSELSIEFLCGQGKEEYRLHRDCFTTAEVDRMSRQCNETYFSRLREMVRQLRDASQVEIMICGAMDELQTCMTSAVEEICGHKAGSWIETFKTYLLLPVKRHIGCDKLEMASTEADSPEKPVIFYLIVGAFFAVLTSLIVVIVVWPRVSSCQLPPSMRRSYIDMRGGMQSPAFKSRVPSSAAGSATAPAAVAATALVDRRNFGVGGGTSTPVPATAAAASNGGCDASTDAAAAGTVYSGNGDRRPSHRVLALATSNGSSHSTERTTSEAPDLDPGTKCRLLLDRSTLTKVDRTCHTASDPQNNTTDHDSTRLDVVLPSS